MQPEIHLRAVHQFKTTKLIIQCQRRSRARRDTAGRDREVEQFFVQRRARILRLIRARQVIDAVRLIDRCELDSPRMCRISVFHALYLPGEYLA